MSEGRDEGALSLGVDPWRELSVRSDWDRLVLPDELRSRLLAVADPRAQGTGTRVLLFGGPRGAGKTSVARSLAARLRLPALEVDADAILEGDPAVAATRVERLFELAAARRGVLVLDHAGATLRRPREGDGAPSPAAMRLLALDRDDEDRPLGIVIVCAETTRDDAGSVRVRADEAFVFPELAAAEREAVWRHHLPVGHGVAPSELGGIARAFRLPASAIARCAQRASGLAAEHDAAPGLADVAAALDAEYRGRIMSEPTRAALAELTGRVRGGALLPRNTFAVRPAPPRDLPADDVRRRRRWPLVVAVAGAAAAVALGLGLAPGRTPAPASSTAVPPSAPGASTAQIAYASGLDAALQTLNVARASLGAELADGRSNSVQIAAATELASAHLQAATAIGALNAGAAAPINRTLTAALRGAAGAYTDMARAVRARDAAGYATAGHALSGADASMNAALAQLRALGTAGR